MALKWRQLSSEFFTNSHLDLHGLELLRVLRLEAEGVKPNVSGDIVIPKEELRGLTTSETTMSKSAFRQVTKIRAEKVRTW